MANNIYRGPANREAITLNVVLAGAYLPGSIMLATGTITAVDEGRLLILGNRRFYEQDSVTAYASGDTGILYRLEVEQEYQAIFAAGTYTANQELTVNSSGQLAAAATTNRVVAFYDQAGATLSANDLGDVVIANSYVKA